jgi:hypothetical protein
MASRLTQSVVGMMLAGSLMASSTAAVAATVQPVRQADPWAVLAVMSGGAPAAAVCGAAMAAAASAATPTGCVLPVVDAVPVPVQPAPPPAELLTPVASSSISPLVLALLAIAAGVGVYLALHHSSTANSPA